MRAMEDRSLNISITVGTVVKIIVVLVLAALIFEIRSIVLDVLVAIIIASAIEPAAQFFVRRKLPRVLAVLVVYILLLSSIGILFYFFLPVVVGDLAAFLTSIPQYVYAFTKSGAFSASGRIIGFDPSTVSPTA